MGRLDSLGSRETSYARVLTDRIANTPLVSTAPLCANNNENILEVLGYTVHARHPPDGTTNALAAEQEKQALS